MGSTNLWAHGDVRTYNEPKNLSSLVRSGDKVVEYTYNKRVKIGEENAALIGDSENGTAVVYGNQGVSCKVRIHLPGNNPELFSRYRGIVDQFLTITHGNETKLLRAIYIDPKTQTKWKIVRKNQFLWTILKILRFFNISHMFHFTESPGFGDYELKQKRSIGEWITGKSFPKIERRLGIDNPHEVFRLSDDEVGSGLRYEDAFTKIATLAYQHYEHDFVGHDEGRNAAHIDSDWIIVLQQNELRLVPKKQKEEYKEQALAALQQCRKNYEKIHGKEKVDYAQHLSYINFDRMAASTESGDWTPLTPEHIYRMNINLTSVESQDLEALISKMHDLKRWCAAEEQQSTKLIDFIKSFENEVNDSWPVKETEAIIEFARRYSRAAAKDEVTLRDYLMAVADIDLSDDLKENPLDAIPYYTLSCLINSLKPSSEARENAYTGRKIFKPIESPYTVADQYYYKPWVDQQELLQTYGQLENDSVEDPYTGEKRPLTQEEKQRRFDELASFIVSRKHLFKPHPAEGYRVGEIIPAPSALDGIPRWYRLARVVASHEGLLYHYFEPVGRDSGLQTCMIAKSTSSIPYAFEGEGTVRNDLNPIHSPGYEGRRHIRDKVEKFRKAHTIPAWTAYQYAASKILQGDVCTPEELQQAELWLERAALELEKDFDFHNHKKSLHEIVREFDAEFNDVVWRTAGFSDLFRNVPGLGWTGSAKNKRDKILSLQAHAITRQSLENESPKERKARQKREKEEALFLMEYICTHAERDEKGVLLDKYQELIHELCSHIFHDDNGQLDQEYAKKIQKDYLPLEGWKVKVDAETEKLRLVRDGIASLTLGDNQTDKKELLDRWNSILHDHARALGEDIDSKKLNGMRFAGHSLGGALAQIEIYEMTGGSNRLPVPGTQLDAQLYDDPGMSHEDNTHQYVFMVDHREIMKEIGSAVNVYHSYEYGDVAPTCATAHLGGITPAVRRAIEKKLDEMIHRSLPKMREEFTNWVADKTNSNTLEEVLEQLNIEDPVALTPQDLLKNKKGRELLVAFFLDNLDETYTSVVELKKATSYALESETGDCYYKHGTRFESTRREKSSIISIVNRIASGKLKIDVKKDIRLLGDYLERYSPGKANPKFSEELAAFQQMFHPVSLSSGLKIVLHHNLEFCVKLAAKAKEEGISVSKLLENPESVANALFNNPSVEALEYLSLRKKIESGGQLTKVEKSRAGLLHDEYGKLCTLAVKSFKQCSLRNELIPLAKRKLAEDALRAKNESQSKSKKKISDADITQKAALIKPSAEELESAIDQVIAEFQNDMAELENLHVKLQTAQGKERKFLQKQARIVRDSLARKHIRFLQIVNNQYHISLKGESDNARKRALGGVKKTYVGREGLGALSGLGSVDSRTISKIWGFGVFHPKRTNSFRMYVGRQIAPYVMKKRYLEEARDRAMKIKGHSQALLYRDKKHKILTVDSVVGPIR